MFCTNCGTQLLDGAKFCVVCGTRFDLPLGQEPTQEGPAPATPAPVPAPTPVRPAPAAPTMPSASVPAPAATPSAAAPTVPQASVPTPAPTPTAPQASVPEPAPVPAHQAPAAAPPATPTAPQAPKSRKLLPVIIGVAAALVVGVVVFALTRGGSSSGGGVATPEPTSIAVGELDESVAAALADAEELADGMAARYESYFDESGTSVVGSNSGTSFEDASTRISAETARAEQDRATLEAAADFTGRTQAIAALDKLLEILVYEQGVFDMQHDIASSSNGTGTTAMLSIVEALYQGYQELESPAFLEEYNAHTVDKLPTIYQALIENLNGPSSTLSQYSSTELLQWWLSKQNSYDNDSNRSVILQCKASAELLGSITSGALRSGAPSVSIDAISRIAPQLYPSLDAAAIVDVTAFDSGRTVTVSAEVVGFTQPFEEQYVLAQGYNRLPVKPATLPASQMGPLSSNSDTQLNVKVIDTKSGAVLAQKSQPVELLSKYDFVWSDDEFGATAAFDILAWLRPQCDEVLAINRQAAEILGEWTGGQHKSIVGYQYGDDWSGTLYQVAAIQKAMSDAGVVYIMDNYSYTSEQHVLTPDQVVQKRQGLCIESSLLMASCLMSAGMHPMIILIPGHAQVAIETYSGSGNYFLIETTTLPYAGIDTSYEYDNPGYWSGLLASNQVNGSRHIWTLNGTSDEWQQYFDYISDGSDEFGGVFVIDCRLQKLLGIQGLETL